MLFSQPDQDNDDDDDDDDAFTPPQNLSMAGAGPGYWNVTQYVQEANLDDLIAVSFFTVTAQVCAVLRIPLIRS